MCYLAFYKKWVKNRPKPEEIITNNKEEIDQKWMSTKLEKIRNVGIQNGKNDLENVDF